MRQVKVKKLRKQIRKINPNYTPNEWRKFKKANK